MQKTLPKKYFERMPRVSQIHSSYCGPAALQMLLGNLGFKANQKEIIKAAQMEATIKRDGSTVFQLAAGIKNLFPELTFWFKDNATVQELRNLVIEHKVPVGVEWQGIFLQYADDDDGHYSVVTHIEDWDSSIYIADPYPKFAGKDRMFKLNEFEERWWDFNDIKDPKTKRVKSVKDFHMMFIVTFKDEVFPKEIKMIKG